MTKAIAMERVNRIEGTCPKCIGSGMTPFIHVEGGICFECSGTGKIWVSGNESTNKAQKSRALPSKEVSLIGNRYQATKIKDGYFEFHGLDKCVENHFIHVWIKNNGLEIIFSDGVKKGDRLALTQAIRRAYKK
jgi:hypothetical protein